MNPVGEGSDLLLCAMTVVRREIDLCCGIDGHAP